MERRHLAPALIVAGLVAAALFLFRTGQVGGLESTSGGEGIVVAAPSYEERIAGAVLKAGTESVSKEAAERVEKLLARGPAKVMADRPAGVSGLPSGIEVAGLLDDPDVKAALLGDDERAAAQAVREKGGGVVVVHTRAAASADRTGRVLSRLYHHDFLEYFALFRVGEGLLFYEVRERPLMFPPQLAMAGIGYLRARLSGQTPTALPELRSETGQWTFVGTLRGQGRELAIAISQEESLRAALDELAGDLEMQHRRYVEWYGFPKLVEAVASLSIELQRVFERATLEQRDEKFLEAYWEPGIDGAYIISADKKEKGVLPGAASYTRSLVSADKFLRETTAQGRMSERRAWRDPKAHLESFRSIHYREVPGVGINALFRGAPPMPMSRVTLDSVKNAIVASGGWYLANLTDDGHVTYKFWPSENRYSDEYNEVRHTLATWNLVQAWNLDPRPEFLEGAKRALGLTNSWIVRASDPNANLPPLLPPPPGGALYRYQNRQKLGTAVVSLLGMIDLARATGDHQWDDLMKELGIFSMSMQEADGRMKGYHVAQGHPDYGQSNDIVPGEAALALVNLAEYFDDDAWLKILPKYWEFYMPWFREKAAKVDLNAPWPGHLYENQTRLDLVEFGPWTVMAANAYHRRTGDALVAKFGLEVARWMIETYEYTKERSPFPDYLGGYYKFEGELPAMQAFCYGEGTAAAYQLALRASPEEVRYFEEHTRETVRLAMQMQYDGLSVYPFSRPQEVLGGFRYALNETKVRIDYVYHAQSTLVQWYEAAKDDPGLPAEVRGMSDSSVPERSFELPPAPPGAVAASAVPGAAGPPAPFSRGQGWRPPSDGGGGDEEDGGGE